MNNSIHIGDAQLKFKEQEAEGSLVTREGETYYKIENSDSIRPFFMSIVSDSNHWMFISSNGGLTAGRKNSEFAIFPYYTDDKITESSEITGSKTIFRVSRGKDTFLWEPFSDRYSGIYSISRNLYKNTYGNKILFEEINHDLKLSFQYQWNSSNKYGFVRRAVIKNLADKPVGIVLLDGIQNIVPYGVTTDVQAIRSNLVDAYKKSELLKEEGLGIYALSAIIVDRAEPSEALKANTVWSFGFQDPIHLVSSLQLERFRKGFPLSEELEVKGEKGAYFISADLNLGANDEKHWMIVANVNQGPSDIPGIRQELKDPDSLQKKVMENIQLGTRKLVNLAASADGLQNSRDQLRTARHYANVLYNIMRGGIIDNNYILEKRDFLPYIRNANLGVYEKQLDLLEQLPEEFTLFELRKSIDEISDPDLKRLCYEYLPLKFSRRHGDPSRPWNRFSINTRSELDGSKILDYEGNWRDIFQNWEALAHAYPEFIDGMIHKFLNASTFDGYNPYRVTKGGIDWEVIEPDDPWSYIGYWGDHQIIYLLKFLEIIEDYFPGRLGSYWNEEMFVYANVPYKIKNYEEILKNPKDTIEFDNELDEEINTKRSEIGADGALITDGTSGPYHVNLAEKILATLLAKLSNFIPEGGIWLNTQRPEWNDANNALVGNGVSMVTLYYLKRFLDYFRNFLNSSDPGPVSISEELVTLLSQLNEVLQKDKDVLEGPISDEKRRDIVDGLGKAGSEYRSKVYQKGFSGVKKPINKKELSEFLELVDAFAVHTIDANKRPDNLYHAYNLMSIDGEDKVSISYLNEMLEGQVAVLSSGHLDPEESLELLRALRKSALYREDQNSYILYPDKDLPGFVEKNCIPEEKVRASSLLLKLLEDGNNQILERDVAGVCHFNGSFNNANSLNSALSQLPEKYMELVEQEREELLQTYEDIFDHKSFTGRSGTFFGYEGLGSIYWHMVSKLLLAAQEICESALQGNADENTINGLVDCYREINDGIGFHKSPDVYGAFPTDPYSHTPAHRGAQQPGMTGQVKEDILSRIGELGVQIENGQLSFGSGIIDKSEFLEDEGEFEYVDIDSSRRSIKLPAGSLAFTFCQVPVTYLLSDKEQVLVTHRNGKEEKFPGLKLDKGLSKGIFRRSTEVEKIQVYLDQKKFI